MTRPGIELQLRPHERAALLKWNATPNVQDQLQACSRRSRVVTIRLSRVELDWVTSDLNHAIVKRDCRDEDVFELAERLEYVLETGDGSLDAWY